MCLRNEHETIRLILKIFRSKILESDIPEPSFSRFFKGDKKVISKEDVYHLKILEHCHGSSVRSH